MVLQPIIWVGTPLTNIEYSVGPWSPYIYIYIYRGGEGIYVIIGGWIKYKLQVLSLVLHTYVSREDRQCRTK